MLRDYAALFSGAKHVGVKDYNVGLLVETVAVATRACRDSPCHDRVARLTNLIQLRLLGDFRRFRRSLAERHDLVSFDLIELHDNLAFSVSSRKSERLGEAGCFASLTLAAA